MPTKTRERAQSRRVKKSEPAKQTIQLSRGKGNSNRVHISLSLEFDPDEIGEERASAIYRGYAELIKWFLTPEEAVQFLTKLTAEGKKIGVSA